MIKKTLFLLGLIILVGFFIRFYHLGKNPPGVTLDEAAIGWNAYSILKTGRDEYGKFLPLEFRSLDDYKPPLYIYLTVPAVAVFGMNEFSVRLPAAVLGVIAIAMAFLLTKELFPGKPKLSLIAALGLAIDPWAVQFSRTGFETGTTICLYLAGLFSFSRGLKRWYWMVLSAILFGLTIYMYQASRLFVPMFVCFLFGISIFYKKLTLKKNVLFFIPFLIICLPFVKTVFSSETQLRLRGTSIFQNVTPADNNLERKITDWLNNDHWSVDFFHQNALAYGPTILGNYLIHLRPDFLFLDNYGSKVAHAPNYGLFPIYDLILIPIGIFALFRKNRWRAWIIIGSVLVAPIPAALTLNLPSSIRTAVMVAPLILISALGLYSLPRKIKYLFVPILTIFLAYYLHMYFVHLPIERADSWYFGYREMAEYSNKVKGRYNRIYISNRLDQPLNFFEFFLNYDPEKYLSVDGGRISGGFQESGNHFGKFYFIQPDLGGIQKKEKNVLYVGTPDEFSKDENFLRTISLPNGIPWIRFKEIR
jgi:4-amino-4-deoxy-L-arabinose transferase-like glycosyltransferase